MASDDFSSDDFDKLLDDFIASQLKDAEDSLAETLEPPTPQPPQVTENENISLTTNISELTAYDENITKLALEERRLFDAYTGFMNSSKACGLDAEIEFPELLFSAQELLPRFRPTRIDKLNHDILKAWEVLISAQPVRLSSLPNNASDEQILNFAEKTTDKNLQLALISYVETLIEIDACEIAYNLRRVKYEKHKIEKKLFEEQQHRRDTMRKYIEALKAGRFPVDAEMLVNNFFKTVRKDPDGAQKTLENNPATFAPIQIDKIPPRFFGMIKAKPEDGIKVNKRLGKFLKNLKA